MPYGRNAREFAGSKAGQALCEKYLACSDFLGSWHHKRVMDGLLLEPDYLRKSQSGQELHVEGFFDRCLKFKDSDCLATPEIDDSNATFELVTTLGKRNAIHGRRRADFREAHEGIRADDGQTARETGKVCHRFTLAVIPINNYDAARSRFEHPKLTIEPTRRMGHR